MLKIQLCIPILVSVSKDCQKIRTNYHLCVFVCENLTSVALHATLVNGSYSA